MKKELPEPQGGFVTRWSRIDNGVYFVDTTRGATTAVHRSVAAGLSGKARELGTPNGEYMYYGFIVQNIPLYELSKMSRAVARYIRRDSAMLTEQIRSFFPDYWEAQNISDENDGAPEYGDDYEPEM
ncbi:MAG: hypothetical protein LBD92_05195 [Oscillospiraceae bacterium]|jgi:hypothetical protein|nr:hypothetical protein [Oscillospiraceae bacterium]